MTDLVAVTVLAAIVILAVMSWLNFRQTGRLTALDGDRLRDGVRELEAKIDLIERLAAETNRR